MGGSPDVENASAGSRDLIDFAEGRGHVIDVNVQVGLPSPELWHPRRARPHHSYALVSTERERERLGTAIEELDREQTIGNRSRLPNELIHARLGQQACSVLVDVAS